MNDALFMLGFTGIFIIIGGIALGWVLRQLLARQLSGTLIYMVVWGSIFSLGPLLMGASSFVAMRAYYLILVQILVFLAAIAIAAFTPQEYLSAFSSLPVILIAFGGVFLLIGAAVFVAQFRQGLLEAIMIGAVFALVGGVFLAVGLVFASRNR